MIIGITGTLGAGKGTIVEYLISKGYTHYSVRDFLSKELDSRGITKNRDTMLALANELRAQYGPGFIAEQLLLQAKEDGGNAVIESIRSVGEATFLKRNGALIWAIDADPRLRYERVEKRATETDHVTFEQFKEQEAAEYNNSDPSKPNLRAVIMMADDVFTNNGTTMQLFAQIEHALMRSERGTESAYTPDEMNDSSESSDLEST
jgi:dephospho-CoA kinase